MMSGPLPRIRAASYAATVRFRIKGQADGPVYQGQELVRPCVGCGVPMVHCSEGLGNRVATLANALTWHPEIRFEWVVNEHCPVAWHEVFPAGVPGVSFSTGKRVLVSKIGGRPAMEWDAARCPKDARRAYAEVMGSVGIQGRPDAPSLAIVARFHRAERHDIAGLVWEALKAAREEGTGRVFVLADQHREEIAERAGRFTDLELVWPHAPELRSDLERMAGDVLEFVADWKTAIAARRIVALDGPTSLLHPARAAGACISYA